MWWVGHAQLFISAGAAAIGVVSTVVTVTMIAGRLEPSFYWTLTFGAWMLAYALPFLTSGIALRAAAVALAEIDRPSGRIILGIVYVITIAVVSVIFVFACTLAQIWVLWPITTWIQSSIEPSMY
ncbi:hypothetical protein ASC59_08195 [Leifsonia sp. Root1293]|nr:hypothetical protein ASC59_08195 [Leifsonia sp. Root1293]KRA11983.1 hypothetical protein ASD61_08195 [Leifsonia sp. Root60]